MCTCMVSTWGSCGISMTSCQNSGFWFVVTVGSIRHWAFQNSTNFQFKISYSRKQLHSLTNSPGLRSLLAIAIEATGSACQKRWLWSVHAVSTWPEACAGPACVQHTLAMHDLTVPMLYVCVLFVIFCGLRFSHIVNIVLCMHLVHVLHVYVYAHVHSLRLALQCHAFI